MAMELPDWLREALNYGGFDWPSSNEDTLNEFGEAWAGLVSYADTAVQDATDAIEHVVANNEGDIVTAVQKHSTSDESNIPAIKDFANVSGIVGTGYSVMAGIVVVLKGAVIAQLAILAAAIASAVMTAGLMSGAVLLAKEGCKRLIDLAIDQAITELLEG